MIPRMDLALVCKFTVFCECYCLPFLICPSPEIGERIEVNSAFLLIKEYGCQKIKWCKVSEQRNGTVGSQAQAALCLGPEFIAVMAVHTTPFVFC